MRFARPPDGFRIVLSDLAALTLEANRASFPRLSDVWGAHCERLKFTAHRDGLPLSHNRQVIKFEGDAAFRIPTIAAVYVVVGDRVEIEKILVST